MQVTGDYNIEIIQTANRVYIWPISFMTIKCHERFNQLISRVRVVDALLNCSSLNQLTFKWSWCYHRHPSTFVFVYFTSHPSRLISLIVRVILSVQLLIIIFNRWFFYLNTVADVDCGVSKMPSSVRPGRIVNGNEASEGEFPWYFHL